MHVPSLVSPTGYDSAHWRMWKQIRQLSNNRGITRQDSHGRVDVLNYLKWLGGSSGEVFGDQQDAKARTQGLGKNQPELTIDGSGTSDAGFNRSDAALLVNLSAGRPG
ncbi:hypothetical protein TWF730_000054 [Orbilia blumenaviensis]|uniref:Uncharacterized protein n=1 Tax=Orbilia blumenaviensis TaxID=1796055 RepID=A0AAV9VLI6_9PEZI